MSFFRRQRPVAPPADGIPPRPAADLRAALLALNGPDVQYVVRDGTPEGVDLVAEWQVLKPIRTGVVARTQEGETFQIRMRLVADTHEVRAIDHAWEFTLAGDDLSRKRTTSHSQGQLQRKYRGHDLGRAGSTPTYSFDTADLKSALQSTTRTTGWTWHPLRFTKP